jgi:ATP-dependent DNA ligase
MAARIDNGRALLLTRAGLDWTDRYPSVIAPYAPVAVAGWRLGTTRKNAELYGCL